MGEPYLKMVDVKKSFPGVVALKGVNFEAYSGEVLALVGANGAGKSTLMNILGGVVRPDEGQIYIDGQPVQINDPLDAARHGVAFVHQEMAVLPSMSIADTMYITSFPKRYGLIDYKQTYQSCRAALRRLDVNFDPSTKIRNLSPGGQQMVEIARTLLSQARIIIFDEPTSSLTSREKEHLFRVIRNLKAGGSVIIYITHILDEVFSLCDKVVVLRDGETVGGGLIQELTYEDIVRLMIGTSEIGQYFKHEKHKFGEPVLEVEGLSRKGVIDGISFSLRKGEVVGLWGLLGSGRTEVARSIVGLDPLDAGLLRIRENGGMRTIRPAEAKNWIGMVTENRREEGLLLPMSVKLNMSMANLRALTYPFTPFIDSNKETSQVREYVKRLQIKISRLEQLAGTLSGGNQQKVVIGRWLQRNPIIFIMDEPTRGLDVGAKAEIRGIINELSKSGAALLVISSEIDEIMAISDRFLVMYRGRIVSELPASASKEELMSAATGVAEVQA